MIEIKFRKIQTQIAKLTKNRIAPYNIDKTISPEPLVREPTTGETNDARYMLKKKPITLPTITDR
ncbi:MAG: hypothetical protein ACOYZ6_04160 [Chloroflexota bacterium]